MYVLLRHREKHGSRGVDIKDLVWITECPSPSPYSQMTGLYMYSLDICVHDLDPHDIQSTETLWSSLT